MIFANAPLRLSNPGGYNRLENLALNFVPSTVNCKLAFLTSAFTTTAIAIVGAPTFAFLCATEGEPKNRSKDRPLQKKERGVEEDKTKSEDEEPTLARTARVGHPKPSQRVKAAPPAKNRRAQEARTLEKLKGAAPKVLPRFHPVGQPPDAVFAKPENYEARGGYH